MLLTLWTVRIATALYVLALTAWTLAWPEHRVRILWTLGCLAFLMHVVSAFHFQHHWSHDAAWRETARQTAALFAIESGSGLYLNYLFTAVWAADASWWWAHPSTYSQRARWITVAIHAFLAFMFINGAIVFASPPMRWSSLAALVGLIALRLKGWGR